LISNTDIIFLQFIMCITSLAPKVRRSFLLAPAHPGWPWKRAMKWLWYYVSEFASVFCYAYDFLDDIVAKDDAELLLCLCRSKHWSSIPTFTESVRARYFSELEYLHI